MPLQYWLTKRIFWNNHWNLHGCEISISFYCNCLLFSRIQGFFIPAKKGQTMLWSIPRLRVAPTFLSGPQPAPCPLPHCHPPTIFSAVSACLDSLCPDRWWPLSKPDTASTLINKPPFSFIPFVCFFTQSFLRNIYQGRRTPACSVGFWRIKKIPY